MHKTIPLVAAVILAMPLLPVDPLKAETRRRANSASQLAVITNPRPALLLVDSIGFKNEQVLRFESLLDGLGISYKKHTIRNLSNINPSHYQLIIAVPQRSLDPALATDASRFFGSAINGGTNVLLMGPILCSLQNKSLRDLTGVELEKTRCATLSNEGDIAILNAGDDIPVGLFEEKIIGIRPKLAIPRGRLANGSVVFTDFKVTESSGRVLAMGISLLDYWKASSVSKAEYYKRPLVLASLLRSLLQEGYIGKHSSMNGHFSTFLFRWEDVVPTVPRRFPLQEYRRVSQLLRLCEHYQIPINIAVIARYVSPTKNINDGWKLANPPNSFLRSAVKLAIQRGGSLIVHGYTHQYGDKIDDMTALDAEMSDDKGEAYRSFQDQLEVVRKAVKSAVADWGVKVMIWETPHYLGNADTYRAVFMAGFRLINESDAWIFPNWHGINNMLNGKLLNIPETATNLPDDPREIQEEVFVQQASLLPDLYAIGAPYLLFFHIGSDDRLAALSWLFSTAEKYDFWKPGLLEYASFWIKRERVAIKSRSNVGSNSFLAAVSNGFPGLTLVVRLPDDTAPAAININGRPVQAKWLSLNGHWFGFPVVRSVGASLVEVKFKRLAG